MSSQQQNSRLSPSGNHLDSPLSETSADDSASPAESVPPVDEAELTASKVIPFPGGALAADGVSRLPDAVGGQGDEGPSPQGEMALPVRGELNLRLLAPLIRCLQEEHPPEALSRLADRAGVACVALQQDLGWLTHEQFEGILHEAREWLGSDEGFQRACAYQMKRRYFPMNLVFRAVSLRQAFQIMSRTMRLVSTISHFEVSPGPHPHAVALRYHSSKPESRLMCLSRQARSGAPLSLQQAREPSDVPVATGAVAVGAHHVLEAPARRRHGEPVSRLGG